MFVSVVDLSSFYKTKTTTTKQKNRTKQNPESKQACKQANKLTNKQRKNPSFVCEIVHQFLNLQEGFCTFSHTRNHRWVTLYTLNCIIE